MVGCLHVQCHAIAQFVSLVERKLGTSLTKETAKWRRQGTQTAIVAKDVRSSKDESTLQHHSILALFAFIHNFKLRF